MRVFLVLFLPLCALGCGGSDAASPSSAGSSGPVAFFGAPATAQPLTPLATPAHPHLAPQGRNGMHADASASGVYDFPGPLGMNSEVDFLPFVELPQNLILGGECATVTIDARGRLLCVCASFLGLDLYLLERNASGELEVIGRQTLPQRASTAGLNFEKIQNDSSGGAYFHLMAGDRPLIADAQRRVRIFEVEATRGGALPFGFRTAQEWDLNPALPKILNGPGPADDEDQLVTDAIPDWDGDIWFVTRQGTVGVIGSASIQTTTLDTSGDGLADEEIQNSLAVSEDGVFIVSDFAIYRFETTLTGAPVFTWRAAYDRGTSRKPGAISQGSGTTPTLIEGPAGERLVAISDNADGRVNIVVYDRGTGREVCRAPVFEDGASVTENSLIGYRNSLVVENNYGYVLPPIAPGGNWTAPGVTRVDVVDDGAGGLRCEEIWTRTDVASQTCVPKLSTGSGLLYFYTREDTGDTDEQAYYLTAVDFRSGEVAYRLLTGTTLTFNNNWAPITLGPDGTAYVGVFNGLIAVKDR